MELGADGCERTGAIAMAIVKAVFTLAHVAKTLGEDADWLYEISCGMEEEEGCIWIYDADVEPLLAFTELGLKNLAEIVRKEKAQLILMRAGRTDH